jgi:non-homologous end joining protein Ku
VRSFSGPAGPVLTGRGLARCRGSQLIKGFEYKEDRYVVVGERQLEIAPRSSGVMEVSGFVASAEVDPVYLDAS